MPKNDLSQDAIWLEGFRKNNDKVTRQAYAALRDGCFRHISSNPSFAHFDNDILADIYQDAIIRMSVKIKSNPDFTLTSSLQTYLNGIAEKAAHERLRKEIKHHNPGNNDYSDSDDYYNYNDDNTDTNNPESPNPSDYNSTSTSLSDDTDDLTPSLHRTNEQSTSDVEADYIDHERIALIRSVVNEQLMDGCKEIIWGCYEEDKTMEEMAQELFYANADSVKTKKYKCMQKLKSILPTILARHGFDY